MKKMMCILFVLGLMLTTPFSASAGIVNGDFSTSKAASGVILSLAGNPINLVLNKGWYTNTPSAQGMYVDTATGKLLRNTYTASSMGGSAQFFTMTNTGALKLQFDLAINDAGLGSAGTNIQFTAQLYGYKFSTTFTTAAIMTGADSARLYFCSTTLPISSTVWAVTSLATYDYIKLGSITTTGFTVDLSDTDVTANEYDFYGIRIMSSLGVYTAGDSVAVDNVGIVSAIPEPATVGMLGLGALVTLLFRRMRG